MLCSEYTTCAGGCGDQIIQSVDCAVLGGSTAVLTAQVWGPFVNRFMAIWVNGIYYGRNIYVGYDGILNASLNMANLTPTTCLYIQDAGSWSIYDMDSLPDYAPLANEAASGQSLSLNWLPVPTCTSPLGDSQLSAIQLTGCLRNVNMQTVADLPTRGSLSYSIVTNSSLHTITLWNGSVPVATGSTTGSSLTFVPLFANGPSGTATLTYSADIGPGVASFDVCYPKSYQIHWSTAAMSYPRQPQALVPDSGDQPYTFTTPILPAGNYNYNVLAIDDEGVVQTAITAPADSPLAVNSPPTAATIIGVTGDAAACTLKWAMGQPGCFYTVYYSYPGAPICMGTTSPTPIVTAIDAQQIIFPAFTNYAPFDRTSAFNTLAAAFNTVMSNIQTEYSVSLAALQAAVSGGQTTLLAAIATYQTAVSLNMYPFLVYTQTTLSNVLALLNNVGADWQVQSQAAVNTALSLLGNEISGAPEMLGGTLTANMPADNILAASQPFLQPQLCRCVVRATNSLSIQETTDQQFTFEFASDGSIVGSRPNDPTITGIFMTPGAAGKTLVNVNVQANDLNGDATSSTAQAFWAAYPASVDYTSAQGTARFSPIMGGIQRATVTMTIPASFNAWATIAVRSLSQGQVQSVSGESMTVEISTAPPTGPSGVSANVTRGQ